MLISRYSYIRHLSMTQWRFDPMNSPSGHSRPYEVNKFSPLTFDRIEIGHWGWSRCASSTESLRVTCCMTYLGHHMVSRDLDLRLYPGPFKFNTHMFRRALTDETRWPSIFLVFFVQKLFVKHRFCQRRLLWPFLTAGPNLLKLGEF